MSCWESQKNVLGAKNVLLGVTKNVLGAKNVLLGVTNKRARNQKCPARRHKKTC